jgi:hypothetical protein
MVSSPICGEYAAVCTGSILGVHRDSFATPLAFGSLLTIYAKSNKTLNIRRVWVSIGFELGHCERLTNSPTNGESIGVYWALIRRVTSSQ